MLLTSVAEVMSIGAVLPFLGVLASPEAVFQHELALPLIQLLALTEPEQLMLPLTVAFSVAALVSGLMRILLLWGQTRLAHAIGADMSYQIYQRTLYQPYSVHVARNSSEVIAGISTKANQVVQQTILPGLIICSSLIMLVMILFTLIIIDPYIAAGAVTGFVLIYGSFIWITKSRLIKNSQEISLKTNIVLKVLQEGLGGIRDVLIDGTQSTYCKAFRSADLPLRRAYANNQIMGQSPRYGVESLGMVLIAVLAYSLGSAKGGLTEVLPVLGALAVGAQRMLPILQQAYWAWSQIRGTQSVLQDALELIEQPLPKYLEVNKIEEVLFQKNIILKGLGFRYSANAPWILKDVSLKIPKGSRFGFIGTTGSGKSTLLDIIMGLLNPSEGSLTVDGIEISDQNQRGWQSHIAHIPQSIYLSDASIIENIAFGVPKEKIDCKRAQYAAQQAQIAKTIESWADEYNTMVGERGVRLSGGQRQRIGVARALYKQADVIILDEATSALDNKTENALMKAVDNIDGDITVLIVAHRVSTLKNCDQIVEIEKGIIKWCGSYTELIEKYRYV